MGSTHTSCSAPSRGDRQRTMTEVPSALDSDTCTRVLICRGCCCGSERKHPAVDHDGQIVAISALARARVVNCVGECAHSNVVIVRSGEGPSVWLGGINNPAITSVLCEWLDVGASQPLPRVLQSRVFVRRSEAVGAGA